MALGHLIGPGGADKWKKQDTKNLKERMIGVCFCETVPSSIISFFS